MAVKDNGTVTPKLLGGITGKGFMPGVVSNPEGARGSVAKLVRDLCRTNDRGNIEQIVGELYKIALEPKGGIVKLEAIKYIIDRVAGKPTVAIAGEDGEPLRVGLVILPAETP